MMQITGPFVTLFGPCRDTGHVNLQQLALQPQHGLCLSKHEYYLSFALINWCHGLCREAFARSNIISFHLRPVYQAHQGTH